MKPLVLTLCLALTLSACGKARERVEDGMDGARGFLSSAFGGSDFSGGGLCGDPLLVGERIGDIPGPGGCGVEKAVRLQAVGNVRLSQAATVECGTARSLKRWLEQGAVPALGNRGGGVSGLKVAAHYSCRTRNGQRGARLSEHAKGRAIDISAIYLRDGSAITVLDGWGSKRDGKALRRMHGSACGLFGTVLGPESDRFHQDHFHFDIARHRGGAYCR